VLKKQKRRFPARAVMSWGLPFIALMLGTKVSP
jgi:hypothetical protein